MGVVGWVGCVVVGVCCVCLLWADMPGPGGGREWIRDGCELCGCFCAGAGKCFCDCCIRAPNIRAPWDVFFSLKYLYLMATRARTGDPKFFTQTPQRPPVTLPSG